MIPFISRGKYYFNNAKEQNIKQLKNIFPLLFDTLIFHLILHLGQKIKQKKPRMISSFS